MLCEFPLFEINLYLSDEETFYKTKQEKFQEYISKVGFTNTIPQQIIENFDKNYIAPWQYNQVFGVIRFFICGTELRGELFLSSLKHYVKNSKHKKFEYEGKLLLEQPLINSSRNEIIQNIEFAIKQVQKQFHLYPDLSCYNNLKKIINWENILEQIKN